VVVEEDILRFLAVIRNVTDDIWGLIRLGETVLAYSTTVFCLTLP
jgi:hypothetical protein